jgi:hypothetical protein
MHVAYLHRLEAQRNQTIEAIVITNGQEPDEFATPDLASAAV